MCKSSTFFKRKRTVIVLICMWFFKKLPMYLVQQPDPNQPKPEGAQMLAVRGEQLGVVTNWPPSLEAALQRWGTISPKAPCLTTMDTNGKPLYILTYGNSVWRFTFLTLPAYSSHFWGASLTFANPVQKQNGLRKEIF